MSNRLHSRLVSLLEPAIDLLLVSWRHRKILSSITKVELLKRYSGSVLGGFWLVLHPLFLLGIYLFVYAAVFRMQLPDYEGLSYAAFVFCGLIPFIGLSEALSSGVSCVKQNLHLVKNVMLPIELIPIRSVFTSVVTQLVGMVILVFLLAITGQLSIKILLLPIVIFLQLLILIGLVLILSSLGVVLTDTGYFLNLLLMLLVFISPIGFTREMVPNGLNFIIDLNPVTYLIDAYRWVFLKGYQASLLDQSIFIFGATSTFALGALFFARFKDVLIDYE